MYLTGTLTDTGNNMAIRVVYQPSVATGGAVSLAAGRGLFEQKQDVFNEEARRFDEGQDLAEARLAQQESQFGRNLQYQQELALLRNRQFEDQQAQQAYQFGATQQASAYQNEMNRRNRLQQMGYGEMFQRGREERADTRAIAGEERADERNISSETRQQQRRDAEKQWLTANKDAELILKKNLRPEQLEQVAKQWEQRNGRDFPYQGAMQERMGESEGVVMARGILEGTDVMTEGMAAAFEGLPPEVAIEKAFGLRTEYQNEQKDIRANQNRLDVKEADNAARLEQAMATAIATTKKEEQAYLDKRFAEYMKPYKDENEATKQRDPQKAMDLAEADLELRKKSRIVGQEALPGQGLSRTEALDKPDGWHGMVDGRMGTRETRNGVKGINWD